MLITDTHVYFVAGYLSNWYPCSIYHQLIPGEDVIEFNCSEQIYMAYKAIAFDDQDSLKKILESFSPKEQKLFGRQIKNFDQEKWNEISRDAMFKACFHKFDQNSNLRTKLLETGTRTLVEAAWYDTIWGVGLRETDPLILDEKNWKGTNWLGQTLMDVRKTIRALY